MIANLHLRLIDMKKKFRLFSYSLFLIAILIDGYLFTQDFKSLSGSSSCTETVGDGDCVQVFLAQVGVMAIMWLFSILCFVIAVALFWLSRNRNELND